LFLVVDHRIFIGDFVTCFTISPPRRSRRMKGLSPEHPEASEPLHTATPEGTPEDSPHLGEIPLVTLTHVDVSDVPKVFTPPPQVDPTDPLAEF
jgi:hypothetical protein